MSKKFTQSQIQALSPIKSDVIKSLSLYYFTFVDVMEFKDHVTDLLTTIDTCLMYLDLVR